MRGRWSLAGGLAVALAASSLGLGLAAYQGAGIGQAGGSLRALLQPPPAPAAKPGSAVDAGFTRNMLVHHDQAVTMARLALAQASPPVRALAQGMLEKQLQEIGWFQGWLTVWGLPADGDADMRWMERALRRSGIQDLELERLLALCRANGMQMAGLVPAPELDQLSTLRGPAFDQRFLGLMVVHHQGALAMAQFAAELAESGHVRDVARSIRFEQAAEITRMRQMALALADVQRAGRRPR